MNNNVTKTANNYLIFASLAEILISTYSNTRILSVYDSALENKLKNLKANFERTSKHVFKTFSEDEQLVFFNMVNIFEAIIESAGDNEKFINLLSLIEEFQKGELQIIEK